MSYNGYNYSHYFSSASQNTDRQGSRPSQSSNSINLNHPTSSYRQQQSDTRGYNASQPRQWNDQPNGSVQPSSNQWYSGSNATSGGGYQGSTVATSASGPQSQYIGAAGRSGGSHLDTSALGSLAYASGLESSGVDSQPLQSNGRAGSDYNIASRRIQTPPSRLVSPMYGNTTTSLANSNDHVRSGSTGSKQSQFVPSYRHAQQQLPTGHGHPQSTNTNHSPHQPRVGVLSPDRDAQSRHGSYTSSYSNTAATQSGYRMHNSELPTQQARSVVPERRTSSPRHSQQVHPSAQFENHRWQTSSGYGTQASNAQANNNPPSHQSPETTSRSVQPAASKHPQLDPAYGSTEASPKAAPQLVSQTNGTDQSWNSTHRPSSWEPSRTQDAPTQAERVRHHQMSQRQELRDAQPHPHQNLIHHDLQHPSMSASSTIPITVDPSRVFNPYHQEYQRRKALADAEEARKDTRSSSSLHGRTSEQSQASTRADSQVGPSTSDSGVNTVTPVTGRPETGAETAAAPTETAVRGANSGLETSEKEQMEAEMKLMLEKMREYKAKDPSLFLQIWDQVKKGTTQTTMKTPTLPQGDLTRQTSSPIPPPQPPSATDGSVAVATTDNSQLPSPSPTIIQPPVAWESPVDSSPDLGKFPAMRRRRGAGRRSRLPKQLQTEQSEKPVTSNQTFQAIAYESKSHASVDASSHESQGDLQIGQQNEPPNSSNITLQISNLPAATRDDRQISRTLPGVRPPSTDRTFSTQAPSEAPQPAVGRPIDGRKQSFKGTLQVQPDSAAAIPTNQSSHNQRLGIVWPDSKKTALATAAEKALTSNAANAGKTISIGVIRTLLDSNPSYIELCESFEKLGFVFDRGHFARMLLAAVPDINSSTATSSTMNATSKDPTEINRASQDLSRAAVAASAESVNRAAPPSTTADAAGSAPRPSPKLSVNSRLSAMSPNIDVGQALRSETLAQPNTVPLHLMKRSPGRPRKDGSPAQPRKDGQIRQVGGKHVNSPVQNHASSVTVPTTSRSLPIDPALLAADRENRQRLGSHSDPHMHDHTLSDSHWSKDHQQVSGSRETAHNVPHQDLDGFSTTQSVVNGSADAEGFNRNAGPEIPKPAAERAPKQWLRDNLKWDPSRMWTNSSIQDRSGPETLHNLQITQVPPHRNAKRDNASNLNANLPTQQYSSSSHLPKPTTSEHLSKREMARKRDFNDIVDLTQHLSGEEDNLNQPLQKRLKEDSFKPPNSAPEGSLFTPSWVVPSSGVDTPVTAGSMDISKFNLPSAGPLSQKTAIYMDVIKPLNKRHALRRSEYNAKTIARDVLIAAGRHPDMRPLNAHLDSLRRNFYAVEFGSDLATFNWEVVDPTPAGDHGMGPDGSIHDADDEDDGIAGFEQQTSFAIAQPLHRRAVISSTNGGVEVFGTDIQIQRLGKGTSAKRRDPLRHSGSGHSARPAGPGQGGHANQTPGQLGVAAPANRSSAELANAGRGSSSAIRVEVSTGTSGEVTSNTTVQENPPMGHVTGTSERKPRGRPPKLGHSSSSTPSRSAHPSGPSSGKDDTDDDKAKKRRGRPPGSKNRTPQSSGSRAEGQFTVPTRPKSSANTTPARSALRNASTLLGDQGFAVMIDPTSRNTSPGRSDSQRKRKSQSREPSRRTRGRPSAASKAEPTYKVYECRWKDCKAELHNLETLRKHVRKVHRVKAAFGGIPCLWTGCGKVSFVQDRKTGRHNRVHQYLDFGTEDLWDQHMDKKHLEPFAWDLGDGPSAGPSDGPDTDLSDYLSDRKGRRMTPLSISSGPQDALILPAKKKPLRAYNKTHGNRTELEKAQAIFKALEHRKQVVGPGIERGGCTLVTPARRAALRDSEFAVKVLDEDDESS